MHPHAARLSMLAMLPRPSTCSMFTKVQDIVQALKIYLLREPCLDSTQGSAQSVAAFQESAEMQALRFQKSFALQGLRIRAPCFGLRIR